MKRTMITVLGSIAGFIEGVVFFVIVNLSFDAPFGVFMSGDSMDFSSLIFGGVGAICGAVVGWAAYGWTREPQSYVPVLRRRSPAGDRPNEGPLR